MTSQQLDISSARIGHMPIAEIIRELQREYNKRLEVYPAWIQLGKISSQTAIHRLAALKNAVEQLKTILPPEPLFRA